MYVTDVWNWSNARIRRRRRKLFVTGLKPQIADQLEKMRTLRDRNGIRLTLFTASMGHLKVEALTTFTNAIRTYDVNVELLETLIEAIDALPADEQTFAGGDTLTEQREQTRKSQPQDNNVTLSQVSRPSVSARLTELEHQIADSATQSSTNTRCAACRWFRCRCDKTLKDIEQIKEAVQKTRTWRTHQRFEAVEKSVRERAAARKEWVSPAHKIVR